MLVRALTILCASALWLFCPLHSVAENVSTFNVTVLRSGNTGVAASIQYSDNGTGTATGGGVNYSFTGGTLNFAAGETQKTFPVTIVDTGR